ncbi:M48 family metalloprotease [Faucicola boevrei]|uniref:hypothetical protein n=1 Tax=Faucicola boevrei TaxID=346665 RepID=UPI0012EAFCD5|nr:hypothetical protein [Moraxella boevrei]
MSLLIFQNASLIARLNERVDNHSFVHYFNQNVKLSLYISFLPMFIFAFLVWRFAELLIFAKMWGAGAVGLIVIMGLAGVAMIWLSVLIQLILRMAKVPTNPKLSANMGGYHDYNG